MRVTWHHGPMAHLTLGTAQWGNGYGITNALARIPDNECAAIAQVALASGIHAVDTALSYGDAQKRLRPWAQQMRITTKVSGLDVESQLQACLGALAVTSVDSVLLHDWDTLDSEQRRSAVRELGRSMERGHVQRVGTSIYDEGGIRSSIDVFTDVKVPLGVMQVPANALDRRLDEAAVIHDLQELGTHIQLRSVLLQGLLAQPSPTALGKHPDVRRFHVHCTDMNQAPVAVALAHAKSLIWVDEVVVGVTAGAQLQALADIWAGAGRVAAPLDLTSEDLDLIDPRRW